MHLESQGHKILPKSLTATERVPGVDCPPSQQQAAQPSEAQPKYLRSQHFHEDEGFPDVGGLFLPGATVLLLLSPHVLQS